MDSVASGRGEGRGDGAGDGREGSMVEFGQEDFGPSFAELEFNGAVDFGQNQIESQV